MWLFINKLTILRSGEGNLLNSGHLQVYLNKKIEIYVTSLPIKRKKVLSKAFFQMIHHVRKHVSKQYTITNTKHLHNSQLVMFK